MMQMSSIRMTTVVERHKLLQVLRRNLHKHSQIVQEARDGYVQKARQALEERLEALRQGRIVSLTFSLSAPRDYTEVYRNSIEMLEWSTQDTVELQADEFRQLVRDEWSWTEDFFCGNANYSATASRELAQRQSQS